MRYNRPLIGYRLIRTRVVSKLVLSITMEEKDVQHFIHARVLRRKGVR